MSCTAALGQRKARYEQSQQELRTNSLSKRGLEFIMDHAAGNWAKRGAGALVRIQERAEVAAGVVRNDQLDQ